MRAIEAMRVKFTAAIRRFAADTQGATAIEYAMIAAGVGGTIAATVWTLGSTIQSQLYNKVANAMK